MQLRRGPGILVGRSCWTPQGVNALWRWYDITIDTMNNSYEVSVLEPNDIWGQCNAKMRIERDGRWENMKVCWENTRFDNGWIGKLERRTRKGWEKSKKCKAIYIAVNGFTDEVVNKIDSQARLWIDSGFIDEVVN